jgi:hypothetical protein
MKLYVVFLIWIACLAGAASAADVGIVAEFPDGSVKTDCVSDLTSGYDILQQSAFDVSWSGSGVFGRSLCKIDGVGDEVSGTVCEWDPNVFWAFFILDGNVWQVASVGAESYTGVDRDVIGFVRSGFDFTFSPTEEPPLKTYEQVCEKLKVEDIKVYVDGKKESGADEDGGKIDVIPGSKVELKINLENLYTDDEDVDIEEITIEGTLEDIDSGSDIEDEINEFDLSSEKDKEVTLKFDIPLDVEEDDYDLIMEISGNNERSFPYSQEIEFEVEVDKENHGLIFNKILLDVNGVCGLSSKLSLELINIGSNEESVELAISNEDLGLNNMDKFKLDPENIYIKNYLLFMPENKAGKFPITISAVYGDDRETEIKEINVRCGLEQVAETLNTKSANNNGNLNSVSHQVQEGMKIEENQKLSSLKNKGIIITVALADLFILSSIILLIFKFLV